MANQIIKFERSTSSLPVSRAFGVPVITEIQQEERFFIGSVDNASVKEITRNRIILKTISNDTILTKNDIIGNGCKITSSVTNNLLVSLPSVNAFDDGLIAKIYNNSASAYNILINSNDVYLVGESTQIDLRVGEFLYCCYNHALTKWELIF
jgi:hypothetical protein